MTRNQIEYKYCYQVKLLAVYSQNSSRLDVAKEERESAREAPSVTVKCCVITACHHAAKSGLLLRREFQTMMSCLGLKIFLLRLFLITAFRIRTKRRQVRSMISTLLTKFSEILSFYILKRIYRISQN